MLSYSMSPQHGMLSDSYFIHSRVILREKSQKGDRREREKEREGVSKKEKERATE